MTTLGFRQNRLEMYFGKDQFLATAAAAAAGVLVRSRRNFTLGWVLGSSTSTVQKLSRFITRNVTKYLFYSYLVFVGFDED